MRRDTAVQSDNSRDDSRCVGHKSFFIPHTRARVCVCVCVSIRFSLRFPLAKQIFREKYSYPNSHRVLDLKVHYPCSKLSMLSLNGQIELLMLNYLKTGSVYLIEL